MECIDELEAGGQRSRARAETAERRVAELEAQLPEGMKHCAITFHECEKGHGRLSATNWIDNGCHWCKLETADRERDEARAALFLFREFVDRNVTQWRSGAGDHHHPVWEFIAETLGDENKRRPTETEWRFIQPNNRAARAVIKQGE